MDFNLKKRYSDLHVRDTYFVLIIDNDKTEIMEVGGFFINIEHRKPN